MSYAQPSPPKIQTDFLREVFLILKDLSCQLAGVAGAAVQHASSQGGDVSLGCFLVGVAVLHGVEPLLSRLPSSIWQLVQSMAMQLAGLLGDVSRMTFCAVYMP